MNFENQVVLVSGAGRGIGKEIALGFARAGADIGFAEISAETAEPTANENWEAHLRIHLFGAFYCSQAAAREMAKRKYGRIVSLASVAGFMSPIDLAPYGVAKSGIIGLTRSMALELADYGITANAIAPGPIDTEMVRAAWTKEALEERANHLPIRRLGRTEEIARVALFLAAPDSSYISGATLVVDGGSVAAGAYMVEKYRCR